MRVLVVEDDVSAAEALRRALTAEGWVVDLATDGRAGYDKASYCTYEAIILDIMVPHLSGYEILRRLRAAQIMTPVLMLTAKDGDYDEIDAFDLGADDYLTKPYSVAVLAARLRSLVRRVAPARPSLLTAGTLSLDPAAHTVARGSTEITLTPREFAVLEFLMRNRGMVVTKGEILRSVWDENSTADDNLVEVYIGYLRRRIDRPFDAAAIETVRGEGYRLVDS